MGKIYTRNYDNMFTLAFGGGHISFVNNAEQKYDVASIPLKICSGELMQPINRPGINPCAMGISSTGFYSDYHSSVNSPSLSMNKITDYGENLFVCFGGSDREVSYEDYELVQPFYSNMTIGARSYYSYFDNELHKYTRTCKFVVTYSGTSQITVKEFGVYATAPNTIAYKSDGIVYSGVPCLIYRETFDNPFVLNQNDAIEITYSQAIVIPHYQPYPQVV